MRVVAPKEPSGNGQWNVDQIPAPPAKTYPPLIVPTGTRVRAADQDNLGTVTADDGGPKVGVHFDGQEGMADVHLERRLLTTLDGRRLDGAPSRPLPPIKDVIELWEHDVPLPPELIQGILHQGSKLSFGGASKGYKTWTLDWLAMAVSHGLPWLGCETIRSKVLLIDLELQEAFCRRRLQTLQEAMNFYPEPGWLDVWNLRGFTTSHTEIFPRIIDRIAEKNYGLVVLDPIYKLYGTDTDENSARDVAALMNSIESLTVTTGAAVAFGSHFSKGNQAGKSAIDRVSGSGVFSRDPDSLLNLTAHDEAECYTLEATLRNFPPLEPFVVRWSFPLFDRRNDLNPAALKKPGRTATFTPEVLFSVLEDGMNSTAWMNAAGILSDNTFRKVRQKLEAANKVHQNNHGWYKSQ